MQALITTCKGRLTHLKKSLPLFVNQFPLVVVVDWNCPDKTWEWVESNYPSVKVFLKCHETHFHKTAALNLGALLAQEHGATRLTFADADTLLPHVDIAELCRQFDSHEIILTGPKTSEKSSLVGFLSVSSERFNLVKGYDENYIGWGYEDLDMRLRLICEGNCKPSWIPSEFFGTIEHNNEIRGAHQLGSITDSALRNRELFRAALRARMGDYWSQNLKDALPYI